MAMKSPDDEYPRPIRDLLRRLIKAPAALSILWPALLIVAGYLAWHRWGADHVAEKFYGVEVNQLQITPPPAYIRTDVAGTVYRDTAMAGLSLLDPQATAKIASAFSMNPWVRRVVSVRKLPGGQIDVHLQYRRPVAMVLVEKPDADDQRIYFFPVDQEGVLLPTKEFAEAETLQFIHIVVPGVYASGLKGSPFGDLRVESAARLAAVLHEYREQAGIVSINVPGDPRLHRTPQLELMTRESLPDGSQVEAWRSWGSPPGLEPPGEPTAEMKLRTLLSTTAREHPDLRVVHSQRPPQAPAGKGENQLARPASSRSLNALPGYQPQGQRVTPVR